MQLVIMAWTIRRLRELGHIRERMSRLAEASRCSPTPPKRACRRSIKEVQQFARQAAAARDPARGRGVQARRHGGPQGRGPRAGSPKPKRFGKRSTLHLTRQPAPTCERQRDRGAGQTETYQATGSELPLDADAAQPRLRPQAFGMPRQALAKDRSHMSGSQYIALSGLRASVDELDRLATDIANVGHGRLQGRA